MHATRSIAATTERTRVSRLCRRLSTMTTVVTTTATERGRHQTRNLRLRFSLSKIKKNIFEKFKFALFDEIFERKND